MLGQFDWDIRHYIYQCFVGAGLPPDAHHIAQRFGITVATARESLRRLHDAHALFLKPGTDEVLMASPLSAKETDYRVAVGDRAFYANCAWDSLGIPAMLHEDASISARRPLDGEVISIRVQDGELVYDETACVHFAIPFRHWYDDLIDT